MFEARAIVKGIHPFGSVGAPTRHGAGRSKRLRCDVLQSETLVNFTRIRPPRSGRIALVRIFTLVILALVLCSCADSYEILGLHLKRAADDDYDNAGHVPGSGDPGN
jgi:hypothetical protein